MNCDCGRPAAEGMSVCPACFQTALDLRAPPIDWHLTIMQCLGLGIGIGFVLFALFWLIQP
jgi:hypothetical protein